ncbi:MAG: hypothetical protein M3T56_06165 [Chloroflexota bacterium]|nr:hypothetical protein [Chloroflexota bacterium]
MNDDELRRDLAEEDEFRRLLRRSELPAIPPFAAVARRAQGSTSVPRGLAGVAAAVVVIVAVVLLSRSSSQLPTASSASPVPTAECGLPSSLDLARHVTSSSLISSLSSVELTDRATNQMRWTIGFLSTRDAPGPTTVSVRVEITAGGSGLHVLGYELVAPERRTLSDTELVTIAPCKSAAIVVRTAGPLIDGTWPYEVTIGKISVPEGQTVTEKLDVTLTCSNATFTCTPLRAGVTPPPSPTPNVAVLKRSFGVVYQGVRQGWDSGSAPQLRREGDTTSVGELAGSFFNQPHGGIAPEGGRFAYLAQPQDGPWGIYLLDGAKPTEQRRLVALPNEIPGQPVWSNDGTAIAFTAQDAGSTQGVTPKYDSIRTLDLATGRVTELARITDGSYYDIVGWDRRSGTLAALIVPHAQPASTYLVIGATGTRTTPLERGPESSWAVYGSPDARTAAGIHCTAATGCSLWTWPLADYDARADQRLGPGLSLGSFGWRPGSDDLGLSVSTISPAGSAPHLELWSSTAGRRTAYAASAFPPSSPFFRADGSAIIIPGYGEALVIDIGSGATSPLPFPAPAGPFERPLPAASIRLGAP